EVGRVEVVLRAGADVEQSRAALAQALGDGVSVIRTIPAASSGSLNQVILQAGLVMVGLLLLFAAGFVIFNAFAMSVAGRMQEIGTLRTLGMTQSQVLGTVLGAAAVLGLGGAGAGIGAGLALAWSVMWVMDTLNKSPFAVPWWGLLAAPLLGLGVTLIAAWQPARQASRVPPIVAVRQPGESGATGWYVRSGGRVGLTMLAILLPGLTLFGLLARPDLLEAGLVLAPAMIALLGAMILALPTLIGPVAALVRPLLLRWLGTTGRLAVENLGRNRLRAALTTGALTAALTTIIATNGFMTLMLKGGLNNYATLFHENIFVMPNITAQFASGELSMENFDGLVVVRRTIEPEALASIEEMATAGQIEIEHIAGARIPDTLNPIPNNPGLFVDHEIYLRVGNFDFFEGNPEQARALMDNGRAMLIQPIVAERLQVEVGDSVPVQTSQGEIAFTVAGIGGSGWNMTIFPYEDGVYFEAREPVMLGLFVPEGSDIDATLEEVRARLASFPAWQAVNFQAEGLETFMGVIDQFRRLLNALLLLAVVVAALGVANTMVINVSERSKEIALLRAVGATQHQVRQMVLAEAMVLGVVAALLAALISVILLVALVVIVSPNATASVGLRADWSTVELGLIPALREMGIATLVSLVMGPLLAGLAAYYPARQAAAREVADATRSEAGTLQRTSAARPEAPPAPMRALALSMARRQMEAHRTRSVLTLLAIALGVGMTVATDVIGGAILNAFAASGEDIQMLGSGIFEQLAALLSLVGVGITGAAGFLVFNAFAMAVTQRRQQIGALRSLGMTRRQILEMVLTEALLIGAGGTLLGLLAGPLIGRGVVALLRTVDTPLNIFAESVASWETLFRASALGLGVTLLSALFPAWQATRLSPLVALRAEEAAGIDRISLRPMWAAMGATVTLFAYLARNPPGEWVLPPWDGRLTGLVALLWLGVLALLLPGWVGVAAAGVRAPFRALFGATGLLVADHLGRGRGRTTLTVATLAIGMTLIVAMSGFIHFALNELFGRGIERVSRTQAWTVSNFDFREGLASYSGQASIRLSPEVVQAIEAAVAGQAEVGGAHFAIVPELSGIGPNYISFILDPRMMQKTGDLFFTFGEGDWGTAMPILEAGCGVLVSPAVARKNGVGLGQMLIVQGLEGPLSCTVAGIGQGYIGASIIGASVQAAFDAEETPVDLLVVPGPESDPAEVKQALDEVASRYPGTAVIATNELGELQYDAFEQIGLFMSGLLVMTIVIAALGVVNTTLLSVSERRRELGLLRAVGAMQRQVGALVAGEAALLGLLGAAFGLVAGAGLTVIVVVVFGGNGMGADDLALWPAAWRSLQPALRNGMVGLLAAPLICAVAAWLPTRALLRGPAIQIMQSEEAVPLTREAVTGFLGRGSLRTRFVLGTGLLLLLVLAVLNTVVICHARLEFEARLAEMVSTMAVWNARAIEVALPRNAQTLSMDIFEGAEFDASTLLRFQAIMDEMSENGLTEYAIADQDHVALISLDPRDIGTLLPPPASAERVTVLTTHNEQGEAIVDATAPIRNDDKFLGSVRLRFQPGEFEELFERLRNGLWAIGLPLLFLALAASWALSTPIIAETRQLAHHARQLTPLPASQSTPWPWQRLSLRTRLTAFMVLCVVLLVGALEATVLPVERREVEGFYKQGLTTGAEWVAQMLSEQIASESALPGETFPLLGGDGSGTFQQLIRLSQNYDQGKLQQLSELMNNEEMAYLAMVNPEGEILLSDQLSLIGESAPTVSESTLEEGEWNDEAIWIISTPIREGHEGAQVGTLRMGARRESTERFLAESRIFFRLAGLSALLAGILLAQGIGGAVTAPLREMAEGTRRIRQGDLDVKFWVDSNDELAQLAAAYNEMVAGLREREWLRDMFGRFVSQEVAEALRTGQVRLEGESRVVSVLFCDIRGFTARSERSTPQQVVALLNEYLPVVVDAAQSYQGTVNKFGGDSTLVIYGAPRVVQESAYQAMRTALEMRTNLEALNQRLISQGEEPIRIGVGINTGMVLAGAVGPRERQEYTVIGDAVNLASRIEALTKEFPEHEILLSGWSYEALGSRRSEFDVADLGEVEIRGKAEPVRVYALLGAKS
nr:FtsX-like permease family protein [Ardenticatenales bacterium]